MREHPIIFSGEMVRAILAERKAQTRRVIKPQPKGPCFIGQGPYGQLGDRLWVKETFAGKKDVVYKATNKDNIRYSWKSSIFMPRWASRITLEITDVRVERLQDITLDDIHAEGSLIADEQGAAGWYMDLWDFLNAKRGFGWETNPFVWVISFKRIEQGRKA